MGNLVSHAANELGNIFGNAIAAPFKSAFGSNCEEVCKDPWDVVCFIEHLCVSNLIKFVLIAALCYLILLFLYLLCKLGVCKCIGKSLCKMCWTGFATYFHASCGICRFLWQKLMNTKRVYRGRYRRRNQIQQDLEAQYMSSMYEGGTSSRHHHHHHYHHATTTSSGSSRKRKSFVVYPSERSRFVNLRRRRNVSFRVQGLTRRHSRRLYRDDSRFKRRRMG